MARIALATCGTRGIGRAIAIALKADGCEVAAVYRGNDETAKQLQTDQGTRTWKWDVGDFDACASGISQVEREVGPVDVLVGAVPPDVLKTIIAGIMSAGWVYRQMSLARQSSSPKTRPGLSRGRRFRSMEASTSVDSRFAVCGESWSVPGGPSLDHAPSVR